MATFSFSKYVNFNLFNDSLATSPDSFTVLHVNIRSIRKYWDELTVILADVSGRIDAIVLTEINASAESLSPYKLSGFHDYFCTRQNTRGGGIGVFIKDSWSTSKVDVSFMYSESLILKISNAIHTVCLLALYRPPSFSCTNFIAELKRNLERLSNETHLCLVGDINIDTLSPSKSIVCDYLSVLCETGITSTIQGPTREEVLNNNLVSACLDHINIRTSDSTVHSAVISQKLADHYFVACQFAFFSRKSTDVNRMCRLERLDLKMFDRFIKDYDWEGFLSSVDRGNLYRKFIDVVVHFRNNARKTVYVKKRNPKLPWLNSNILNAIDLKEKFWKKSRRYPNNAALKLESKIHRNFVTALIRSAKRTYFAIKISDARFDSRKTWAVINEVRGHLKNNIYETLRKHFGADMLATVNAFNRFFSDSATVPSSSDRIPTPRMPFNKESAFLPPLTDFELRSYLFGFKRFRSAGVDDITVHDLCRNFESLKKVLLTLINDLLETGYIPDELKSALVVPLFKGGAPNQVSSYRPISILSSISQILEKHIFVAMSSFLEKHAIFTPNQYGFISGRGTTNLLEHFSDILHSTFDKNMYACALFIDVAKAFDSVNHKLLLDKLYRIGFRGPFHAILENYLSNRSQIVSIDNFHSSQVSLTSGVPQGSILSPLFFNIYVNDMSSVTTNCVILQYADDTVLLSQHISYHHAINMLQVDANKVMDWFQANKLRVNTTKTKLICFRNPLKSVSLTAPLFLHNSGCSCSTCEPVHYVNTIKYLGIHFDCDLSWNTHMSYLCQRLRTVACMMYHIKAFLPLTIRKCIMHALTYSVLRYGITIFFNCPLLWQSRIDRILRNTLKSIAYNTECSKNVNLFSFLELPTFHSLFLQTVIRRHFWDSEFIIPSLPSRDLRNYLRFQIPHVRTHYGESLRIFYVPNVFNSIPESVLAITSNKTLMKSLRKMYSAVSMQ